MALKKAVKSESKLRMAIVGPAGSGKTYTALKIAQGISGGKPIALFDTEHGSAAKYASDFEFDVDNIAAPFHPDKFCAAIQEAASGGYGVVVLDSLSHAWNGPGGLLTLVEKATLASKSHNSYMAWKDATPLQDKLVQAIVSAGIHVIVTMRSKTDYVIENNAPRKVGMAPVQREGMDYEFDVVLEMDAKHNGIVTKTRCSDLTDGVFTKPGKDVSDILRKWLAGSPSPAVQASVVDQAFADQEPPLSQDGDEHLFDKDEAQKPPRASREQLNRFHAIGTQLYGAGPAWDAARHTLIETATTGETTSSNDLTPGECNELMITMLGKKVFDAEWPAKVADLCQRNGAVSLRDLSQAAVNKSIDNLQKRLQPVAATAAK